MVLPAILDGADRRVPEKIFAVSGIRNPSILTLSLDFQ
jgi:hypothetical protein